MTSFDVARAWHEIYALRIQLLLDGIGDGGGEVSDVCDVTACDLGRWIQGPVLRQVGTTATYRALLDAHGRFHQCAYGLVTRFNNGDIYGAREMGAKQLMATSETVLARLNELEDECLRLGLTAPSVLVAGSPTVAADQRSWNESLRIGMPVIDAQHRMLTELVEKLISRPAAKIDSERAGEIFFKVSRLVEIHFETEESLMQDCAVPTDMFERHRQAHNRILDECAEINVQVMAGRALTVVDIFPLLRKMIIGHIVDYDLALADYLGARPASAAG